MSVGTVVDIVREPLLKRIEACDAFVAAYDAWRKAVLGETGTPPRGPGEGR